MNKFSKALILKVNSKLFYSTGVYMLSKMIRSAIPFLMLPLLTAYLSKEDYGIITMFTTATAFCMPFVTLNLDGAIQRRYYYKNDSIAEYIGNCFIIAITTFLIFSVIFLLLKDSLGKFTQTPILFISLIPFYCFTCFFNSSNLAIWQVKERPIHYGLLQISQTFFEILIAIVLIVYCHYNWEGRAISMIISSSLFALISLFILFNENLIVFNINKEKLIHALKYGGGLIPHAIGGALIVLTNRFFLTKMIDLEETGLYGVASQIASILSFFTLSFNNAFVPWLYKKLSMNSYDEKRKIVKFSYLYFGILLFLGGLMYLFTPFIFSLFINEKFHLAQKFILWIILGYVFQGAYFMVTNYIFYSEKTYILAILTLIVGAINIPLNYICISMYGSIGAAISFAIIFFIYFVSTWILSSKVYKMPWSLAKKINFI